MVIDKLMDKCLGFLPKDPLVKAQFMYYMQGIIVTVLLFWTLERLGSLFWIGFDWNALFMGLLTGVFFFITLFGFQTSRDAYKSLKNIPSGVDQTTGDNLPEILEAQIQEALLKEKEKK